MRKWIVRGCALVFAGLLLCGIGFALAGGDAQKAVGGGDYEKQEYTYDPEGLTKMSIREKSANVVLGVSPDSDIHITCYENRKNRYQISQSDGWEIVKKSGQNWTDYIINFDFGIGNYPLTVLLPDGVQWDVTLENDMGDVTATGGDYAGLTLDTDYGVVKLSDVTADSLAVSSAKGDLSLKGVNVAGQAVMDTDYGKVLLSQVEVTGDLNAETALGTVSLEDVKALNIGVGSDYGDIILKNTAAKEQIEADTDNGKIDLKGISGGTALSFETDLGHITGSVAGQMTDYTIDSKTDLGKNNLPNTLQGGSILLHVYTDLGDIDIDFHGNQERR